MNIPVEWAFIAGMVVLLLLVIPLKVNAFVGLLLSAVTIGLLADLGMQTTMDTIVLGFGTTVGKIGMIIIFGVVLGQYLEDSRSAERLAKAALSVVGEKRSPLAMAISGYFISIPVFSDVGYVILSPLAKAIARRTGICFAVIAVALSSGLLATHVLVPPTPGPLAVAGLLGIDIGRMILWGGFVAFVMTLGGWAYAVLVLPTYLKPVILPDDRASTEETYDLPGIWVSIIPLMLPLLLILTATTSAMLLPDNDPVRRFCAAIGNANVALFLGAASAMLLLGRRLQRQGKPVLGVLDSALKSAGPIIFITAAGGSLGYVLEKSGAGAAIAEGVAQSGLPFIVIPFIISGLLKTIQGSGTVAVITAAALCLPLAQTMDVDPLLIALSSGAGARLICHVNDSYFWVFANMSGFDTRTALKTLSAANLAMAFSGLAATGIVSWIIG